MTKIFALIAFVFVLAAVPGAALVRAQENHEYAPIQEKTINYKDWTYKNLKDDQPVNLRDWAKGKRLVLVVYFAPWCPNWKHDLPFVKSMYEKYHGSGLEVVAVGEYDPVDSMKTHVAEFKLPFPVVWESDARTAKQRLARGPHEPRDPRGPAPRRDAAGRTCRRHVAHGLPAHHPDR